MRLSLTLTCTAFIVLACAARAGAQEHALGVTIGYPGSLGVVWQPSSRIALRPGIAFRTSGSQPLNDLGHFQSWSFSADISGLIYLQPAGPLRMYVTPRYLYSRISSTSTIEVPQIQSPFGTLTTIPITTRRSTNEHGVAGLVGAEYRLGDRFGVFGEAGLLYTRASLLTNSSSWAVGSTSSVGVALYF
jgi:hypothetical protein